MTFYISKLHFLSILMLLALLNACSTQANYAPVKTDNVRFSEDKQNLLISKQALYKGNQVVTRDTKKNPVVKNQRTFHAMGLGDSDSYGHVYQRPVLWNQKLPSHNRMAESELAYNKQKNTAIKNANTLPKDTPISIANKSSSEDRSTHKKQQIKPRDAKNKKNRQLALIDTTKQLALNFGWPIKGKVLKSFSPSHNKGIDIAGKKGQSVKATEAGKVVYDGQGLIGFGKLLIIKHNNNYLSAYANNSRLLANEGQQVQKGQVIAEIGGAGIKRTSLHFEIRKNGKPVNPLKLLPKI